MGTSLGIARCSSRTSTVRDRGQKSGAYRFLAMLVGKGKCLNTPQTTETQSKFLGLGLKQVRTSEEPQPHLKVIRSPYRLLMAHSRTPRTYQAVHIADVSKYLNTVPIVSAGLQRRRKGRCLWARVPLNLQTQITHMQPSAHTSQLLGFLQKNSFCWFIPTAALLTKAISPPPLIWGCSTAFSAPASSAAQQTVNCVRNDKVQNKAMD